MKKEKNPKIELFEIKKANMPPCSLKRFKIKGKIAELSDFGKMMDVDKKHADPFACKNMKFVPINHPRQNTLDKYNITYAEALEICDELESLLTIGECGYCV